MMRAELTRRARSLITELGRGGRDDEQRDALLCDMLRWQADRIEPYARVVAARGADRSQATHPQDMPALPTDVFRYARVAAHAEADDVRRFETSGTTGEQRGTHAFRSMALYDLAAGTAARHAFFGDSEYQVVVLAPASSDAPRSSLSYMFRTFEEPFAGKRVAYAWEDGGLSARRLAASLEAAETGALPVALLGTSFAFVHAEDQLERAFRLPEGSRIMHTGGYKGRSREIAPEALRRLVSARYGIPEQAVVAEYGMTELSSQMYETSLLAPSEPRHLWVPGWMRAVPVDPDTLEPVPPSELGVLRIDDVANLDSVAAIQTADVGREVAKGIELHGRAPDSVPRGCSLVMEFALGRPST